MDNIELLNKIKAVISQRKEENFQQEIHLFSSNKERCQYYTGANMEDLHLLDFINSLIVFLKDEQ